MSEFNARKVRLAVLVLLFILWLAILNDGATHAATGWLP